HQLRGSLRLLPAPPLAPNGYFRCGPHGPGSVSAGGGEPSSTGGRCGRERVWAAFASPPLLPPAASSAAAPSPSPPRSPGAAPPGAGRGGAGASAPVHGPPANFTSAATRASTDGCVSKMFENPSRGLSMHISVTAEVAPGSSPRPSILRSAAIIASGFLVSST